jgi:hypothetical protein
MTTVLYKRYVQYCIERIAVTVLFGKVLHIAYRTLHYCILYAVWRPTIFMWVTKNGFRKVSPIIGLSPGTLPTDCSLMLPLQTTKLGLVTAYGIRKGLAPVRNMAPGFQRVATAAASLPHFTVLYFSPHKKHFKFRCSPSQVLRSFS